MSGRANFSSMEVFGARKRGDDRSGRSGLYGRNGQGTRESDRVNGRATRKKEREGGLDPEIHAMLTRRTRAGRNLFQSEARIGLGHSIM